MEESNRTCGMKTERPLCMAELHKKMEGISVRYQLIDLRRDRESFYAHIDEIKEMARLYDGTNLPENWLCIGGLCLNLIMDGRLEEADEIIDSIRSEGYLHFLKLGLKIVNPLITFKEFMETLATVMRMNKPMRFFILTASRPSLLNGFNDFSRLGIALARNKEKFIEHAKYIYDESLCPYIYKLCLAEHYYQTNKLLESEMLVSTSVKEFDTKGESRITFSALYLQSKILLAHGKPVDTKSFVKNMRILSGDSGKAEFSHNLDAVEVLFALYEGGISAAGTWLSKNAPDEFADFNMLDLYRYMIKMRCYIAEKKYAAVIALAERLRPLVEKGRRMMDLCELDLLLAMSLFAAKDEDGAFEALSRALKIAKLHRYYRLVADEAEPMMKLLVAYIKKNGESPFLRKLAGLARDMAVRHPLYMKAQIQNGEALTPMEIDILTFLEQGKSKEEIASCFFISVNTVKYHLKNIYMKTGAKNACQAVWNARLAGILD